MRISLRRFLYAVERSVIAWDDQENSKRRTNCTVHGKLTKRTATASLC
nr:MAG TPA: hypothetical protein [Caudoviricetes sp.]DAT96287.1 MAG TPA: hypothetical protein [Caudoviricetes sp.]